MDIIKKHSDSTMEDYTPENSQTGVETLGFMQEFDKALDSGFWVEESRNRTLNFVDSLWRE